MEVLIVNIGNVGEAKVLGKFVELGCQVYIPFGDGSTVDLIAEFNGKLNRIQIKSTAKGGNGSLSFSICSTTLRKGGEIAKHIYNSTEIDYFALYSSITDEVYLLPIKDAPTRKFALRYKEPYTNSSHKTEDYLLSNFISKVAPSVHK